MSRNIFNEDDEPLFAKNEKDENASPNSHRNTLSIEEYNNKQENNRKNKVLSFCFRASPWVLLFVVFLIIADFFAQWLEWNTEIIKDCLSLITYIVTAALGFMFGSNSK